MSSVPSPIIRFTVDAPGVSAAMQSAMSQVRQQAKTTTQAVADDWRRMAAQIRASAAQGAMSTVEETKLHQGVLAVLDRQISAIRTKNELNTKELASLKAMTLEYERQKSFLKGTGGITTGTANALNQASTQTVLGVERVMDSLVNRYFGGAAGAAFRTVRDAQYYAAQAGGTLGKGGFLGMSGTTLGVAGGAIALTAAAAAMTKMAVDGGKLAIELDDMAKKTGLSVDEVVKLKSAAEVLGVNVDSLTVGFKKFDTQITDANAGNRKSAELFAALGVDIKKAAQDPFSAIQQLAKTLGGVSDPALKVALATQLFGRGGQQMLPIMDELNTVMGLTRQSSQDLAQALGTDVKNSAIALKAQMVNWKNETEALEVELAQTLLPTLVRVVGTINALTQHSQSPREAVDAALRAQGLQLSPFGAQAYSAYINGNANTIRANPQEAINELKQTVGLLQGQDVVSQLFEPFKQAAKEAPTSAAKIDELRKAVAGLGDASKGASDKVSKLFSGAPGRIGQTQQERVDAIINGILHPAQPIVPPNIQPNIGASPLAGLGLGLGAIAPSGLPDDAIAKIKEVNDKWFEDTASAADKIKKQYDDQLAYFQNLEDQYPQYAGEISDSIVKLKQDEAKKIGDIQKQELEKYKSQADSLFQDLISGKTRDFSRTFAKDIQNILLKPVEDSFDAVIGGLFGSIANGVSSTSRGSSPAAATSTGGILGRIWGGIFGPTTPPFFGANGFTGSGKDSAGQFSVATMSVTAGTVNVGSGSGSGMSAVGSAVSTAAASGATAGGSGASSTTSSLVSSFASIGKNLENLKGLKSLGLTGTTTGAVLGGAGLIGGGLLMGIGARQGGALGGLEGGAGGALSGFMTGGPIGALIGGIGGLISGILGGPTYGEKVQRQMWKQADYLPPSQTFSFASNGSIASTLGTGFSTSGNSVGMFGLPANTPFYANTIKGPLSWRQSLLLQQQTALMGGNQPFGGFNTNPYAGQGPLNFGNPSSGAASTVNFHIQAMDAKGVRDFFTEHGQTVAQIVGSHVTSSSSGLSSNIRRAVQLP